jgi:hypothetical protein
MFEKLQRHARFIGGNFDYDTTKKMWFFEVGAKRVEYTSLAKAMFECLDW